MDELFEISRYSGVGFVVLADIPNKQLVFETIFGTDRSKNQDVVSPVSFSMEYQNVSSYTYAEDYSDYATTAYVGGSGEDQNRLIELIGDEYTGLDRFEVFIDKSNIKTRPELITFGKQQLADMQPIRTVEASALPRAFIFGRDYYLGDTVTVFVSRLNLELALPITSVTEIWRTLPPTQSPETRLQLHFRAKGHFSAQATPELVGLLLSKSSIACCSAVDFVTR